MTTDPQRYRHRTAEIDAVQWTGTNADVLRAFCGPDFDEIELDDRTEDPDQTAAVREAEHRTWRGLKPGDWVVKLDGGLYEFSAADFAKQYEPAVAPTATDGGAEPVCVCGHPMRLHHEDVCGTECGCNDGREPEGIADLPGRLEAALTARFTELGNQFAEMRYHEQGPDGWPASHPVGPHRVAEVLRELLATEPAVPPPADQAAVLNAAAQHLYTALFPAVYNDLGQKAAEGVNRAVSELRRLAAEAPEPATQAEPTPCDRPNACDPDTGELCATHEEEQAHAEGEHEYCGVTCEVAMPTELMRNSLIAWAPPGGKGILTELLRRAAAGQLPGPAAAQTEEATS